MMFDFSTSDIIVVIGTCLALFWLFRPRKKPAKPGDHRGSQSTEKRTQSDGDTDSAEGDGDA